MITTETTQETIDFVLNAFDEPDVFMLMEYGGGLYAALAPHLRNYAKNGNGRRMAFVSAVGSINYGCATEHSDLDMKAVYYPSFEDLYHGRFDKFSFVTDDFDLELHPIHHYRKHALKGNINFFEPLLTEHIAVDKPTEPVLKMLREMVKMNVAETVLATYFTAKQMNKGVQYIDLDDPRKSMKKASHAIRMLVFILDLLQKGDFCLVPNSSYLPLVRRLKEDESVSIVEYQDTYDALLDSVRGLMFDSFVDGGDFQFSEVVLSMDQKGSERWKELDHQVDVEIMELIKEEI